MTETSYDVFLSYSDADTATVGRLAERLRRSGLRVWPHEPRSADSTDAAALLETALENSRILLLFISQDALGPQFHELERQSLRFRDPLNENRRFIPIRLDNAPIPDLFEQFVSVDWRIEDNEPEYERLLIACRPSERLQDVGVSESSTSIRAMAVPVTATILNYAFSGDGSYAALGGRDTDPDMTDTEHTAPASLLLWDLDKQRVLLQLKGHQSAISSLSLVDSDRHIITGSYDRTIKLWQSDTGDCLRTFVGHEGHVSSLACNRDGSLILSASGDRTLRLWDVRSGACIRVFVGHFDRVNKVTWLRDENRAISCSDDKTLRLWDTSTGQCLREFVGHTNRVWSITVSHTDAWLISGSSDRTIRVWDLETGACLHIIEGHTGGINSLSIDNSGRWLLSSGTPDHTLRLWDTQTWHCVGVLRGHEAWIQDVRWAGASNAYSGDRRGSIHCWDVSALVKLATANPTDARVVATEQIRYTNAKVLLAGESGAGKTGLATVLAGQPWKSSDSTVGAWATQWRVSLSPLGHTDREIWLWDFGGQADQRLIHQLYMEDAALVVLVFDGQKEDAIETLRQWDSDLSRAFRRPFIKLLAAARVDAGGLRVGREQISSFAEEAGFSDRLFETSAKADWDCEELREAIVRSIPWDQIALRSTPRLFARLREEIVLLKDAGRVLIRFNDLREILQFRLSPGDGQFTDDDLRGVIGLLAGPGVVWPLNFGSWILLQPERINAYAQAVIQTLRSDELERGCLSEEQLLEGRLTYTSSMARLDPEEEEFVLLAMHQMLVARGLCLREHTEQGTLLIFPSYYRRERPDLVEHPAVLVSYRFAGFLDEIYAKLVVRLHHSGPFQQDQLWRYAADFRTLTGKKLGLKMTRRSPGVGELDVYYDPTIELGEKIIFSKYVHEHLLSNARDVQRFRHYICPHCGTSVGNREIAMRKLAEGKSDLPCINCDDPAKRVPLWDQLEELFASAGVREQVRDLESRSARVLDNESKDRALVGEVISTVALAGQISREKNVSDHGIDMEIEFKDDDHHATGRLLYLQLKSGDSYLRRRRNDEAEIFSIKSQRHVQYWMEQAFPVFLVIRDSKGVVRWMEVRQYLREASENGTKRVTQIVFDGERFDVMSVRRWRDRLLAR
jgi:WD40 repeat protein